MQPDELKAARKALGWTQQQLADALGMSRKTVVEMEAGRGPIERRTLLAVRYLKARELLAETRETIANSNAWWIDLEKIEAFLDEAGVPY